MILKLCGFTQPEQASRAAELGATHIGVVLWAGSERGVTDEGLARAVFEAAQAGGAQAVAVVVDHLDPIGLYRRVGADRIQLHGTETVELAQTLATADVPFWRALRVAGRALPSDLVDWERAGAGGFVLDAFVPGLPGGTGARVDLTVASSLSRLHNVVLAGGLTPDNVAHAIGTSRPAGVDVASGIERAPGDKDPALMQQFVTAARAALAEIQ